MTGVCCSAIRIPSEDKSKVEAGGITTYITDGHVEFQLGFTPVVYVENNKCFASSSSEVTEVSHKRIANLTRDDLEGLRCVCIEEVISKLCVRFKRCFSFDSIVTVVHFDLESK